MSFNVFSKCNYAVKVQSVWGLNIYTKIVIITEFKIAYLPSFCKIYIPINTFHYINMCFKKYFKFVIDVCLHKGNETWMGKSHACISGKCTKIKLYLNFVFQEHSKVPFQTYIYIINTYISWMLECNRMWRYYFAILIIMHFLLKIMHIQLFFQCYCIIYMSAFIQMHTIHYSKWLLPIQLICYFILKKWNTDIMFLFL